MVSKKFDLKTYIEELKNEIAPLIALNPGASPLVSAFILQVEKLFGYVLERDNEKIYKIREYVQEKMENILEKDHLESVQEKRDDILKVFQETFWDSLTFDDVEFMIRELAPLMIYYEKNPKKVIQVDKPDLVLSVERLQHEVKESEEMQNFISSSPLLKKIKDDEGVTSLELLKLEEELNKIRPGITIENIQRIQKIDFMHFLRQILGLSQEYDPQELIKREFDKHIIEKNQNYNSEQIKFLQILKAVFLEMFSEGLSKDNSHVFLEDVTTKITDGEHITPRRVNKGIYLLSARNILNHKISLEDVDFIDMEEFKKISKRIEPQLGDVLVSCSGSVGRVARVKDDYKFQLVRSVALIRPDIKKLNSVYLEYFFDTDYMQMQISKSINQSSQANLFQGKIRKLKIFLPSLEIQNKFATIVKDIEETTEYQKYSRTHIENLFNSLIQKAFKGE